MTALKVAATLKAHGGHDAPWLVIEAESVPELGQRLQAIEANGIPALVGSLDSLFKAQFAAGVITNTQAPVVQTAPVSPPPPPPVAPAPPAASDAGSPRQCQHGAMVYKSGVSTKGPWQAWMCSLGRDAPGRCEPQFIR